FLTMFRISMTGFVMSTYSFDKWTASCTYDPRLRRAAVALCRRALMAYTQRWILSLYILSDLLQMVNWFLKKSRRDVNCEGRRAALHPSMP
ncbi:MAG: hypothetical protein IJI26_07215, partial [Clostridia bacterium]|nr:hypothetical protein [Clostridia bacterium]